MLEFVREGDTVFVHDFSRLARSTKDLLEIIEYLNKRGVRLVSNKESFDTSTPTGKLMVTMIGAINEFERMNLLERQREGIAIAKRQGKYIGRNQVNIDPEQWREVYERYTKGELTLSALARELDISRPTAYKLIAKEKAPK